jgi:hypothetical protein
LITNYLDSFVIEKLIDRLLLSCGSNQQPPGQKLRMFLGMISKADLSLYKLSELVSP